MLVAKIFDFLENEDKGFHPIVEALRVMYRLSRRGKAPNIMFLATPTPRGQKRDFFRMMNAVVVIQK